MLFTLTLFLIFTKAESAFTRITGVICDKSNDETLLWPNPTKATKLSALCPLYVILRGIFTPDTVYNVTEDDDFVEIIQLELSTHPFVPFNNPIYGYPLEKVLVDHNAYDSNGDIKVYLGNITMPAIMYCGEMYLFIVLQLMSQMSRVRVSISSKRIHALCNKPSNLKIVLNSNTVDDKIIIEVDPTDYVYGSKKLKLKLPKSVEVTLSNIDNQALQARCGVYALQVIAFMVSSKRNRSLDYVNLNDRLVFNALQSVNHNFYNILLPSAENTCSPDIDEYSEVKLKPNYLAVDEDDIEELELVFIIDPLNLSNFSSPITNRTFAFNTTILCDKCKCFSRCQVFAGLDRVIIRHYTNTSHQDYFEYNIETRRLYHLPYNERVVQDVNTYFYTQWIIHITSILLVHRNEFDELYLPHVVLYSLGELMVDFNFILSNTTVGSRDDKNLKDKLVLIYTVFQQTLVQVLQGPLDIYLPQFLKLSLNIMNDNTSYFDQNQNWWELFRNTIEDIISCDTPSTTLAKIIPKRLKQLIRRVYFNTEEAMYVYNYKNWKERTYLTALKIALNMIVDKDICTEELPKEWIIKINRILMSTNQEELLNQISEFKQLFKGIKENSELHFIARVLMRSFRLTYWEKWIELKSSWKKVLSEQLDVYRYGIPRIIYFSYLADDAALKYLLQYQAFPDFLLHKEMTKKSDFIYYTADKGIVTRGEYDGITGSVYLTKIMLCYTTNSTLISKCTITKD